MELVSEKAKFYSKWIQNQNKKAGKEKLPMSSMSGFIASLGCVTFSSVCFFKLYEIVCKKLLQGM